MTGLKELMDSKVKIYQDSRYELDVYAVGDKVLVDHKGDESLLSPERAQYVIARHILTDQPGYFNGPLNRACSSAIMEQYKTELMFHEELPVSVYTFNGRFIIKNKFTGGLYLSKDLSTFKAEAHSRAVDSASAEAIAIWNDFIMEYVGYEDSKVEWDDVAKGCYFPKVLRGGSQCFS